ncbi:hypothetical protein TD95_005073 [Thielaviopsis punctulata]|uniref:Major facilitator superfamily (MFS) profile domain-containing protein n=1 Tax=Thielaviopsis punctulata TaxID=72032 RepID=A0A0F4Z856_9PEZI|nr:hypothetical protein TD95_005073 [Thielaviopsis punctulata]
MPRPVSSTRPAPPESSETARLLTGSDSSEQPLTRESWAGFDDFKHLPWYRRPSIYWLVPAFFLFTLAFGGTIVPKVNLTLTLICKRRLADRALLDPTFIFTPVVLGADNPQCHQPDIQKTASEFMALTTCITGILSAIAAPRLGKLSDRYGRCKLLGVASLGGILAEGIIILAAKFPDSIHYRWLILGAIFDGIVGSYTAGSILSHSYTSDCTPPSKRGVAIGYLHACLNIGLALGPVLAAYLIKLTGSLLSIFYIALACHATYVAIVTFLIPESLSKARQLASREKHLLEDQQLKTSGLSWLKRQNPLQPLHVLWPADMALRRNLVALAVIDTIVMGAAMALGTTIILYSGYVFNWTTIETSKFISIISTVRSFVLIAVGPSLNYLFRTRVTQRRAAAMVAADGDISVGQAVKKIEHESKGADHLDVAIIRFALISDLFGMLGYFSATTGTMFLSSGIITAFGGLCGASTQGAASKHVPTEQVGQLLGAVGLLQAGARFIMTFVFSTIYAVTIESFPNAVFGVIVLLFGGAVVASMMVKTGIYSEEMDDHETPPSPVADELFI